MTRVHISLAGALGVVLVGLGQPALAQFDREGPRVSGTPQPPPPPPAPVVAPVIVSAPAPVPAKKEFPPVDGALPGGVLGPGSEGVGALVRPEEAPPGPLADAETAPAASAWVAPDAHPTPAAEAKAAAKPAHAKAHRRRRHRPATPPDPQMHGPES